MTAELIGALLRARQQVHQHGAEALGVKMGGDEAVARAVAAAAAPVHEQHDSRRVGRHRNICIDMNTAHGEANGLILRLQSLDP
jgi:hypothetical protein